MTRAFFACLQDSLGAGSLVAESLTQQLHLLSNRIGRRGFDAIVRFINGHRPIESHNTIMQRETALDQILLCLGQLNEPLNMSGPADRL